MDNLETQETFRTDTHKQTTTHTADPIIYNNIHIF